MEYGAAITAIVTLIAALVKWYASKQPERDKAKQNAEVRQGRTDIVEDNVAAVSERIDSLCQAGNSGRLSNDEDTKRRIAKITGS